MSYRAIEERLERELDEARELNTRWQAAVELSGRIEEKSMRLPKGEAYVFDKILDKAIDAMKRESLERLEAILKEAP